VRADQSTTADSSGRFAETVSPLDVPVSLRRTHGAKCCLAHLASRARALEFIDAPGLPADAPQPRSRRLEQLRAFEVEPGSPAELLVVLQALPPDSPRVRELDARFGLANRRSLELRHTFVLLQLRAGAPEAVEAARRILLASGRMRYLRPLYTELARRHPEAARRIYREARAGYHNIARAAVEGVLKQYGALR